MCVLRGTEEVFQALEDNQVTLSVMKASRFAKAFEKEVDHWERCLSLVLEVIEMILTVQRQWMYLEVRTLTEHFLQFYTAHYSFKCFSYALKVCGYIIQVYTQHNPDLPHTRLILNKHQSQCHPLDYRGVHSLHAMHKLTVNDLTHTHNRVQRHTSVFFQLMRRVNSGCQPGFPV